MINQTITPPPRYRYGTLTLEGVVAVFQSWAIVRRDVLLREVAELEKEHLGYGRDKRKPTTSDLRAFWQQHHGRCPHCGKELE